MTKIITKTFQMDIPRTCLEMTGVRTGLSSLNGSPARTESSGGSVARAKAAKVSMIRLIHRSCTADRGDSAIIVEPIATVSKAERLTVS